LIEAPSPRAEADAIAVRLRQAVDDGQTAAVITPDRMLTRQITAALDRWDIKPDDSAGLPLQLSPPGRFLRHVADLFCAPLDAEALLVLLRHPLTNSTEKDGTKHGLHTNALELHIRRYGPPFPSRDSLNVWTDRYSDAGPWASWICDTLMDLDDPRPRPLSEFIAHHLQIAERLSAGPDSDGTGALWQEGAGREALRVMSELSSHAEAGGEMTAREYRRLVSSVLADARSMAQPTLTYASGTTFA